jgi:RNA polymerase sigma factor (sigma-70 family)
MAERNLTSSIRGVLRRLRVKEVKQLPDPELLARYVATHDEAAFTALVSRHGPTVLSVCQRVLRGQDADDVFQATFLALAKEAAAIRRPEALGSWLYEVAYHAAMRAKSRRARSQRVEQVAAAERPGSKDEAVYRDAQRVLDEELHQLPEKLRQPLVMVHLLGHIQADAARELGITDRALRKRLSVGRDRLRLGLTRRGLTLTAAALLAILDRPASAAPVAPGLLGPTVESVLAYAAGQTAALPASTVSLAMAGAGGWLAGRFKLLAVVAVPLLATLVFTASALTPTRPPARPVDPEPDVALPPVKLPAVHVNGRTTALTGRILDADGQPVPHAAVTALVRRPWQADDRGIHDEVVARGAADADGWYRITVPVDFPSWNNERRVTLLAHAPDGARVTGDVPISPQALDQGLNANLQMPVTAVASGKLLGPDGKPAAGVRLAVVRLGKAVWDGGPGEPEPSGWPVDVTTNAAGEYKLDGLPAGESVWLQVRDDAFALTTFPVKVGTTLKEPISLTGPRLLTGRITAQDTGRPLAGARVAAIVGPTRQTLDYFTGMAVGGDAATTAPPAEVSGLTDAEGRYRLRLPPAADYHVYVYSPPGASYLGWHWYMPWADGDTSRERTAALPPGVEVRGQVVEVNDKPIGGACVTWITEPTVGAVETKSATRDTDDVQRDSMMFSETAMMTDVDGRFRVVLPKKPVQLRVYGPSADYRLGSYGYERCLHCGKEHWRPGEHARVHVDASAGPVEPVRAVLHRGLTLTGRAVGPDGEPIRDGLLISRTIVQPLRKPAPRTIPIKDGMFTLPGCVADRSYPILMLDPVQGLAAYAQITPQRATAATNGPSAGPKGLAAVPTIPLTKCGTATVRLVDADGRPLAGRRPVVWFWLPDDHPASPDGRITARYSTPIDASWIDPRNYLPGPVTDADGFVTVRALVPGLQYHVVFTELGKRSANSAPFQVTAGQSAWLPDVVLPAETDELDQQPDKLPKAPEGSASK